MPGEDAAAGATVAAARGTGAGANGDFLVIGTDHRIRAAFGLTRGFADFVIQYVYTNKRAWL